MIGLVTVKAFGVHTLDLSVINGKYWTFTIDQHELEGVGHVCPTCENIRIVKSIVVETGTEQ